MTELDEHDRAILRALRADANQSASALARQIGLSQPATWRRIRRLEEAGVIAGRRLVLDPEKLGFGVTVFTAIPEVQAVHHVLGRYDYRLRVVARDLPDFERVLRRRIMTLPSVGEVEANVLLSEEMRPGPL